MSFTVLGAAGFIGRSLVEQLLAAGESVVGLTRLDVEEKVINWAQRDLGHLIYCIGVTADFRHRPFDTVQAHVCLLQQLLQRARFESLTYLSSTRVYAECEVTHEDQPLVVYPADPDHLYNLSKLMGESLCLTSGRNARVVRLSNVYGVDLGAGTFLAQVLTDAARGGRVVMRSAPGSEKDYVALQDVVAWLPQVAVAGQHRIYNLAGGSNLSNQDIAACLRAEGVEVEFAGDAPLRSFAPIDTARVRGEFPRPPRSLLHELPPLLAAFQTASTGQSGIAGASAEATPADVIDPKEQR